jgi:hypothetical protein
MWLIGLLLFKTRGNSSSSGVNSALVLLVFLGRRRHIIKAPGEQTDFSEFTLHRLARLRGWKVDGWEFAVSPLY